MLDGPSIILGNIIRQFEQDKVALFTRRRNRYADMYLAGGNEINARRYVVSVPSPYSIRYEILRRIVRILEVITIPLTAIKGLLVSLKEKPDCILATSDIPHGHFMIAAYFMAVILNKKLFFYLMDPVEEFASSRLQKALLKYFEPKMFDYASGIITMNNHLAIYYEKKYGLECKVLHHSAASSGEKKTKRVINRENNEPFRIVFSGNVSRYQLDALLNLREAIKLTPVKVQLIMYTPTEEKTLRDYGFKEDIVITHADHSSLKEALMNADILFLPLSFDYAGSIIVKAAFPSKTMDYLSAGRPILVHAPPECFIVEYAKQGRFAEVVTDNDTGALAQAVTGLLTNEVRQEKLIKSGREILKRHDPKLKYKELMDILNSR